MVVHSDKLRWLFWLRWKLFTRGFRRDRARLITTIISVVILLPLLGFGAVITYLAYRDLPAPANSEVLFLVLTAAYLLWIVLPLFEFSVNEGLDVSKLIQFPVTRLEIMFGLLISTLLDIPMFGLLLILLAVVVGWAITVPVTLFTIVAMLIFYVQIVGMSQLVLALLMRTLQSRRFRDLSILLIGLISTSCYIMSQVIARMAEAGNIAAVLQHAALSNYLQYLPSGMTARAIQQAAVGNWSIAFAWLLVSLVAAIVVLYLWQLVLERSLRSPESGGAVRTRRRRATREVGAVVPVRSLAGTTARTNASLEQLLAITRKEFIYYWRDPQLKAMLFQSVIYIAIVTIGPFLGTSAGRNSANTMLFVAPSAVFISMFILSYNTLGMERQSLTTLFLFPVEPRRLLMGKNLAVAMIGVVELIVLVLVGVFLTRNWNLALLALIVGLAGIALVLGCGNLSSVFFPTRMRQMRGLRATGSSSGSGGCLRSIMVLTLMIVTAILLIPVALALFLPIVLHAQWAWVITIPASLIYGAAFYIVVTGIASSRMLDREPEILAVTTRD